MCNKKNDQLLNLIKEVWAADKPVEKEFGDGVDFDSEVARIATENDYAEAVVDALESGRSESGDSSNVFLEFCQLNVANKFTCHKFDAQ